LITLSLKNACSTQNAKRKTKYAETAKQQKRINRKRENLRNRHHNQSKNEDFNEVTNKIFALVHLHLLEKGEKRY
jgi:hypothetical protein